MKINIELTEKDLKQLIIDHLSEVVKTDLTEDDVKIEVKSTQNFKSEWETAYFRATLIRTQ